MVLCRSANILRRECRNGKSSRDCRFYSLVLVSICLPFVGMLFSQRQLGKLVLSRYEHLQNGLFLSNVTSNEGDVRHPSSSSSRHLLSVPFYIYPELMFLEHGNITDGDGNPFQYQSTKTYVATGMKGQPIKHSDDYYFASRAMNHPMRTRDPAKAKLFFVPILVNAVAEALRPRPPPTNSRTVCWVPPLSWSMDKMCNLELLQYAERVLLNSTWFKGGADHLIVGGHWYAKRILKDNFALESPLSRTSAITFEHKLLALNLTGRYIAPSMYVGEGCEPSGNKTHDYAFIGTMHTRAKFKTRHKLCEGLNKLNSSVIACGKATMCPTLAQARFGFHVRGDTFGGSRPMDTLLSGTVPLFTDPHQYRILPSFIDWKSMTYLTEFGGKNDSAEWLKSLLDKVNHGTLYESRVQAIQTNRDLFDYTTSMPFELYMYGFQCHLYPETCSNNTEAVEYFQSRYPALRLQVKQ